MPGKTERTLLAWLATAALVLIAVPGLAAAALPHRFQAHTATAEQQPAITAPAGAVLTFPRPQVTTIPAPPPPPAPPPFPGIGLTDFMAAYAGKFVILPGYTTAECVAIFSHYNYEAVLGDGYSAPGAQDLWLHNTWTAYDRIPADHTAQRGDVAIWSGTAGAYLGGGAGHVAIVLADHGSTISTFSQNPNPAEVLELSKFGVLGYLRPHHLNP